MPTYTRSACLRCEQIAWRMDEVHVPEAGVLADDDAERSAEHEQASPTEAKVARTEAEAPSAVAEAEVSEAPKIPWCGKCMFDKEPFRCEICFEITAPFSYSRVQNESWENKGCGHRFCRTCLRTHLLTRLTEGAWNVRCPGVKCTYALIDKDVSRLLNPAFSAAAAETITRAESPGMSTSALLDMAKVAKAETSGLLERYRSLRMADHTAHLLQILHQLPVADATPPVATVTEVVHPERPATHQITSSDQGTVAPVVKNSEDSPTKSLMLPPHDPSFGSWALDTCQACPSCFVVIRKEEGCDHIQCRCGAHFQYCCGAPQRLGSESSRCICSMTTSTLPRLARWLRHNGKLEL